MQRRVGSKSSRPSDECRVTRILAALATVPGRETALAACLASLRPQVDELRVICHDMTEPPACVRDFADAFICEPDVRGSAAKLHWSREWNGIYLGCDDDFVYPADYAQTMCGWVEKWNGRALVVGHGRELKKRAGGFLDVNHASAPRWKTCGRWLNYPGCCAMAFDTSLGVPDRVPGKNLEEAHLAVWAQQHRVPIWLVPHSNDWLKYQLRAGAPTIWNDESAVKFTNRNAVLRPQSAGPGWRLYRA